MARRHKHIVFILDRSGSMFDRWNDAIEGIQGFLEAAADAANQHDHDLSFSLVVFSSKVSAHMADEDLTVAEVRETLRRLTPTGLTALYDAICMTIDRTTKRSESEDWSSVEFVIQTDGQENNSKEYAMPDVSFMIDNVRQEFGWNTHFLSESPQQIEQFAAAGVLFSTTASYSGENTRTAFSNTASSLNWSD